MFRKLLTFVVALSIFSVSAMAYSQNGLKDAFNEFNYAITVEWDQKDESFFNAKKAELEAAIVAADLSNEELIAFAKSQIKDASVVRDLDKVMNAVSLNKMSVEEAQAHMVRALENAQMEGASWHGRGVSPLGVVIIVLIILAIAN